jgi:hypothetical protein
MGYTLFFLAYGAEAAIPSDLDFDAPRVHFYNEQRAKEQCRRMLTCSRRYGIPSLCDPLATSKGFTGITPDGYANVPLL